MMEVKRGRKRAMRQLVVSLLIFTVLDVGLGGPQVPGNNTSTPVPTLTPTITPSAGPSRAPTITPSAGPSRAPTRAPTTLEPSVAPTRSPTPQPTLRPSQTPTRSPTPQPTQRPTLCQARCEAGTYNPFWKTYSAEDYCPGPSELVCLTCPSGTFKTSNSVYEGCAPCGGDTFYCIDGQRFQRGAGNCTFRAGIDTATVSITGFDAPVNENLVRDSQAPCGSLVTSVDSKTVTVVKPGQRSILVTIQNVGGTVIILDLLTTIVEWLSYQGLNGIFPGVKEINTRRLEMQGGSLAIVRFVVQSSAISETLLLQAEQTYGSRELRNTIVGFAVRPKFVNSDRTSHAESIDTFTVAVNQHKLSVLPEENFWTIKSDSVMERILTVYNQEPFRVQWEMYQVDYLDSANQPVDGENWITVSTGNSDSGILNEAIKCTCQSGDAIADTPGNSNADLAVTVNSYNLKPGLHHAMLHTRTTVVGSSISTEALTKITLLVEPSSASIANSTWTWYIQNLELSEDQTDEEDKLGATGDKFPALNDDDDDVNGKDHGNSETSVAGNSPFVLRVPSATLQIVPRDRYGTQTTVPPIGSNSLQFKVSWQLLEKPGSYPSNIDRSVFDVRSINVTEFNGRFDVTLSLPANGTYEISITDVNGAHIRNSPFQQYFAAQLCENDPNSINDPVSGASCLCRPGYGLDVRSSTCLPCVPGFFSARPGNSCNKCPFGTFQDASGQSECKKCPEGYETNNQQTGCNQCPTDHIVSPSRSICVPCDLNKEQKNFRCVCKPEYYTVVQTFKIGDTESVVTQCETCPLGANCSDATLQTIHSQSGFWQTPWDLKKFVLCRNQQACIGSKLANETAKVSSLTTDELVALALNTSTSLHALQREQGESTTMCKEGFYGPLCFECQAGYYRSGDANCEKCVSRARTIVTVVIVVIVGIGFLIYVIYETIVAKGGRRRKETGVLKILISHLQVVAMAGAFQLEWPRFVDTMFTLFETFVSAGNSAMILDCLATESASSALYRGTYFFAKALSFALVPLLFSLIFLVFWFQIFPARQAHKGIDPINYETRKNYFIISCIVLLFLLHPLLMRIATSFLACSSEDMSGRTFLEAQFNVQCEGDLYYAWLPLGIFMLVVYGVGVPVLTLIILFCIVTKNGLDAWRPTFGFIYSEYKVEFYFWEFAILLRKTCFAAIVVGLRPFGIDIQLYAAVLVIVFSAVIHSFYKPYVSKGLNTMESFALGTAFTTLMCGLFLYSPNLGETMRILCSIMVIFLNLGFIFYALYHMRGSLNDVKKFGQYIARKTFKSAASSASGVQRRMSSAGTSYRRSRRGSTSSSTPSSPRVTFSSSVKTLPDTNKTGDENYHHAKSKSMPAMKLDSFHPEPEKDLPPTFSEASVHLNIVESGGDEDVQVCPRTSSSNSSAVEDENAVALQ